MAEGLVNVIRSGGMRLGFPVKTNCDVRIYYKPNTSFLKLHVYLIPCDPALQQELEKRELSLGYKVIPKPQPEMYLRMNDSFTLRADLDSAVIQPQKLKLRYEMTPNFFEVFIENPDRDFQLSLQDEHHQQVWSCVIRKDYLQSTGHTSEKHQSKPLQEEATMTSVRKKLLKILEGLSHDEDLKNFKWFLQQTGAIKGFPTQRMETAGRDEMVDLMVEIYGQQSVEVTREVLEKMVRDLQKRRSYIFSVLGDLYKLLQSGATTTAVKEKLLKTLEGLSHEDLKKFKWFLQQTGTKEGFPNIPTQRMETAERDEMVDLMVEIYGQQSVEVTRKVLEKMQRDLVEKWSDISSGLEVIDPYKWLQSRIEKQTLLVILEQLRHEELKKFKGFLQQTGTKEGIPNIPTQRMETAERFEMVDLMVEIYGLRSVEMTRKALEQMGRRDLVERLSGIPSGLIEKFWSEQFQDEATMKKHIGGILEDLSSGELEQFKHFMKTNLPGFPSKTIETAGRDEIVALMLEIYGQHSVEMTREILRRMKSSKGEESCEILLGSKAGPSGSSEVEDCGSTMQGSSDWTTLEPEVSSTDETTTYSLQSEAGKFECSVSSMRWVSKEKVSFNYQFCSTEEHMERIDRMHYMPAGPLLDVTIIAGKFFEVYLPHWICIDNNPKILEKFAVLHIDDCGDAVEKVSEVTSSHVKLSEPVFSAKLVLVKLGLPVEIGCNMLIYYVYNPKRDSDPPNLKLHVFLIPRDPAIKEALDKRKKGYKYIEKPRPNQSLKMRTGFSLKADVDTAKIQPKEITLRYCQDPNFYEVFIENPDRFNLKLSPYTPPSEPECEPVWTCEIREDDYRPSAGSKAAGSSAGPCECAAGGEKHSVDDHESAAVVKVKLLGILADLEGEGFDDFKWHLVNSDIGPGLERITKCQLEGSKRSRVVDLMWETYIQQSVEVTKKVLENMKKKNLVKKL